jgi:hypothetical protein
MQHWLVLLGDVRQLYVIYVVVQLGLEFWFEWLVISNYESLLDTHWTVALAAATMLFSHWLYLAAAGLDILLAADKDDTDCTGSVELAHGLKIPIKRGGRADMDSGGVIGDLGKIGHAMIREETKETEATEATEETEETEETDSSVDNV